MSICERGILFGAAFCDVDDFSLCRDFTEIFILATGGRKITQTKLSASAALTLTNYDEKSCVGRAENSKTSREASLSKKESIEQLKRIERGFLRYSVVTHKHYWLPRACVYGWSTTNILI